MLKEERDGFKEERGSHRREREREGQRGEDGGQIKDSRVKQIYGPDNAHVYVFLVIHRIARNAKKTRDFSTSVFVFVYACVCVCLSLFMSVCVCVCVSSKCVRVCASVCE